MRVEEEKEEGEEEGRKGEYRAIIATATLLAAFANIPKITIIYFGLAIDFLFSLLPWPRMRTP